MPYPNKNDPLLKCKMQYLNRPHVAIPTKPANDTSMKGISSDDYYENLCMNTINQSIGTFVKLNH